MNIKLVFLASFFKNFFLLESLQPSNPCHNQEQLDWETESPIDEETESPIDEETESPIDEETERQLFS